MEAAAGETINLLKDFVLPILTGVVLPLGLLWVGVEVYRRQKEIDRETELKKEKCDAFAAFVADHLDTLINHQVLGSHKEQATAILKGKAALNVLYLRCKSENVQRFQAVSDAAVNLSRLLDKQRTGAEVAKADLDASKAAYNAKLLVAVNAAREEFGYANDKIPEKVLESFILPAEDP